MQSKNWKKEVFSIPNVLSFFRLLMIPAYIITYLRAETQYDYIVSGSILGVSCLTDLADGWVARKYNMVTRLGKILDPVADKASQFALILCLSLRHPQLQGVLILFVIKEVFQSCTGLMYLRKGLMLAGAIPAGKICTAILFLTLTAMVLFPGLPLPVIRGIAMADCFFLLCAFGGYLIAYFGKDRRLEDLE